MSIPIYLVDAFTARPFAGNPAGVCPLEGDREVDWMQLVALELNQAETAFVRRRPDGDWDLRWFTPTIEVDLCGHATLASAHVLWTTGRVPTRRPIRFHTRSGVLACSTAEGQIEMDFPAEPPSIADVPGLSEALGVEPSWVGRNRMDVLAVLNSAAAVRNLKPDFGRLAAIEARGVIVTARSDVPEADFVSRFFAPQSGVPEDPVTGSAHCCLGPYWQDVLGKNELVGHQVSTRGGVVQVRCVGERCILGGSAVLTIEGILRA